MACQTKFYDGLDVMTRGSAASLPEAGDSGGGVKTCHAIAVDTPVSSCYFRAMER